MIPLTNIRNEPDTRSEHELQLRDYLVTYGQCRALGMSVSESEHNAAVTRHAMRMVRSNEEAVLPLTV